MTEFNLEAFRDEIRRFVAETRLKVEAREDEERASGVVLRNDPVARQMAPNNSFGTIVAGTTHFDTFLERRGRYRSAASLLYGETMYVDSRRSWPAYAEVCRRLAEVGLEEDSWMYELFHYVPGVMVIVRSNRGEILTCIRSSALAGTHTGRLSFPAGLMKPGESILQAAQRQVHDETGVPVDYALWPNESLFIARNPDAPQSVYCQEITLQHRAAEQSFESWEAQGKRFVWVSLLDMRWALRHDMRGVMRSYHDAGIHLEQPPAFAPDALLAAKEFIS